jgi:hypothetical protein
MTEVQEILPNPLMSKGRYRISGDQIYDTWGGYYITPQLWEQWRAGGRSDTADHDFVLGERVDEDLGEGNEQWHRIHAVCNRCGETRQVWWGVNTRSLNLGWCVLEHRKSFWRRLFG